MRVLIHAQHLSGVGHEVRSRELARALAEAHAVVHVDGGRPVPGAGSDPAVVRLLLPRLARGPDGLRPLDAGRSIRDVLLERRERLRAEAARLAPDVLLVEHYPFSKWELEGEIAAAIQAARAANPAVRVVCSLRDVCPQTRRDEAGPHAYDARVLPALRDFDALLVHTDPSFTRLEEHFPAADRIETPIFYTGFVSERASDTSLGAERPPDPFAVLSVGGGGGSSEFALRCVESWMRVRAADPEGALGLVIFAGLFWSPEDLARVRAAAVGDDFLLKPFGPDFLGWLAAADLSISRAGYNTCTNLLETGCPALLVPDPQMSDQAFRARRLAELGVAEALDPASISAETLAGAIARARSRPRRGHGLDLDGARRTRLLLEELVSAGRDAGRPIPRVRLSIVVEWANTRLHGAARTVEMLQRLGRQWGEIQQGKHLASLPREAARFLERLAPRAQLVIVSGEAEGPEFARDARAALGEGFDLEIHVAPGLEYYALKNAGAEKADGDLLLFVDSDVHPDEGWLAHLLGSFADPEVGVVTGQTYVAPTDLFSTAFSLGWTYDLRDEAAGLSEPHKVYANNLAFRSEIFRRTGFRPIGRRSRGASSMMRQDLARLGIPILENRLAAVEHPAPTGFRHMVIRALAHGRDHHLKVSDVPSLRGTAGALGVAARRLGRGVTRALRDHRRVGLEAWELPPVLAIMACYYGFFALGGVLMLVHPEAMTRRFRV